MTYHEAVAFVKTSFDKEIRLGLDRITLLLERLGNPQKKLKYIHVAGTNGKGSVCAMTAEILKQAGYQTGLFTSPVISDYREQFSVNGEMISKERFIQYVVEIKKVCDLMEDPPSEFEKTVALAFLYFYEMKCDLVVLEVGMGGDSDATNVIDCPEVAVITGIDYDHMTFLGNTLVEIAEKKAGIIKNSCDVVVGDQDEAVVQCILRKCEEKSANCVGISMDCVVSVNHSLKGQTMDYKHYQGLELNLLGIHQCENAAVVLEVMDCLIAKGYSISKEAIYKGMKLVSWPGRFELVSENPVIILDGAHNPDGISVFCDNLKSYFEQLRFVFIVGILKDKDYNDMLGQLMPFAEAFVTISPNNARAMTPEECGAVIKTAGFSGRIIANEDYESAIECAKNLAKDQLPICLVGSLYNIGEMRKLVL